jgi:dolichol-phosphate mannosyltransferase
MLSVIVPTYNERGPLTALISRLAESLEQASIRGEIVVVDDGSPDGTADVAESLAEHYPVRVLRRSGKGGLASAVVDGMKIARGDLLAVMDADLSHPPEALVSMVQALSSDGVDLAVGSRYVVDGGIEDWPLSRQLVSAVANWLAAGLTPVRDATSGFFVVRRSAIDGVTLNPIGFKIGLEIIARAHYRRYVEIPYVFTDRKQGFSKFTSREVVSFLQQLAILYSEKYRARLAVGRSRARNADDHVTAPSPPPPG